MIDTLIQAILNRLGKIDKKQLIKHLQDIFVNTSKRSTTSSLAERRAQAIGFMKGEIKINKGFDDPVDEFFTPL